MIQGRLILALTILLGLVFAYRGNAYRAGQEIQYPDKDFARLDTFEALNIEDADTLYNKKDYKGAYAAYKAYSFEFAKSPALPYVLLRMGRCLHHLGKRHAAIKAYQDVVDYFPNAVRYAAAALYYIGECHGQNGDDAKKTAVWACMVKDDEYVAQPNSGTALIYLARRMQNLDKYAEAADYQWRTAVEFHQSNWRAAKDARNSVIYHYVCRNPNHDKLKEFYRETNGFHSRHAKGANPEEETTYWRVVMDRALGMRGEEEEKKNVCRYWAGKFGDAFPKDDGLRMKLFRLKLVYEEDMEAWAARMNKQFASKEVTLKRVIDWVDHFQRDLKRQLEFAKKHGAPLIKQADVNHQVALLRRMHHKVRGEFYAKYIRPTVSGLKQDEKIKMMHSLRRPLGLHDEAKSILRTINVRGMSDEEVRDLGFFAAHYLPEEDVLRYFGKIKDKLYAAKTRFDYYNGRRRHGKGFREKALAEIPALQKSTKYAGQDLMWAKATLLRELGRHEEAIQAYKAANKQPDSTWAITNCLIAMKQYGQAIKTVRGLESVGGNTAAKACFKVADIYRKAGNKGKEVDQLRLVLRRYPKSGQSSKAHQRLENYGVKVVGGEAEAEE